MEKKKKKKKNSAAFNPLVTSAPIRFIRIHSQKEKNNRLSGFGQAMRFMICILMEMEKIWKISLLLLSIFSVTEQRPQPKQALRCFGNVLWVEIQNRADPNAVAVRSAVLLQWRLLAVRF